MNLQQDKEDSNFLFPPTPEEKLKPILEKYRLPPHYSREILRYLRGELSEKRLVCCHTGCEICEENIYFAIQEAKKSGIDRMLG